MKGYEEKNNKLYSSGNFSSNKHPILHHRLSRKWSYVCVGNTPTIRHRYANRNKHSNSGLHLLRNKELMSVTIIIACFFLAGLAEGIMDWLQFRLSDTMLRGNKFWDPEVSWKNKWEGPGPVHIREKFFLSSTLLVFLTDGWHLMKWCRNRFIDVAIVAGMMSQGVELLWSLFLVLGLRLAYGIGFWLTFKKLL